MRFAGTRIEGFMGGDSPNFGQMSQAGLKMRNKEETTATDLMGQTASTGISEAGKVEAANIVGAAQQGLASAQGTASILGGIGKIGGSIIGAGIDAGTFGGGSTDYGSNLKINEVDKYMDGFSNPDTYSFSNYSF